MKVVGRGGGVVDSDMVLVTAIGWAMSGRILANRTKNGCSVVILFSRIGRLGIVDSSVVGGFVAYESGRSWPWCHGQSRLIVLAKVLIALATSRGTLSAIDGEFCQIRLGHVYTSTFLDRVAQCPAGLVVVCGFVLDFGDDGWTGIGRYLGLLFWMGGVVSSWVPRCPGEFSQKGFGGCHVALRNFLRRGYVRQLAAELDNVCASVLGIISQLADFLVFPPAWPGGADAAVGSGENCLRCEACRQRSGRSRRVGECGAMKR